MDVASIRKELAEYAAEYARNGSDNPLARPVNVEELDERRRAWFFECCEDLGVRQATEICNAPPQAAKQAEVVAESMARVVAAISGRRAGAEGADT